MWRGIQLIADLGPVKVVGSLSVWRFGFPSNFGCKPLLKDTNWACDLAGTLLLGLLDLKKVTWYRGFTRGFLQCEIGR